MGLCDKIAIDVHQIYQAEDGQFELLPIARFEGVSPLTADLPSAMLVEAPGVFFRVGVSAAPYEAGPFGLYANEAREYGLDATLTVRDVLADDWEAARKAGQAETPSNASGGC